MTRILGIDTSTLEASVAAFADGRTLAERRQRVTPGPVRGASPGDGGSHSDLLLGLVDEVLRAAGWAVRELEGVACGAGPGSFTGLRIGLSTAKGLCFAIPCRLALVSSLAALAARAPDGLVCATLDAHKSEIYAGVFEVRDGIPRLQGEEEVLPPARLQARLATLGPVALVGDGAARYPALLIASATLVDGEPAPRASDVARLGALRLASGPLDDLTSGAPSYVRLSEAELVKQGKKG